MNTVDHDIERAETQASPEQFPRRPTTADRHPTHGSSHRALWTTRTWDDPARDLTELNRIQTRRSQQIETVGSRARTRSSNRHPLPEFGADKPYPPQLPERENYVVEFNGPNDPLYPQNWSLLKKYVHLHFKFDISERIEHEANTL
jgi:DHA1 family multidrug resistance protein-like MFS transporter